MSWQLPLLAALPRRRFTLLGGAAAATLLVGHGRATCLPAGVDASLAVPAFIEPVPVPRAPAVTVFLDVSASMAGYVAAPRAPVHGRATEVGEPRTFRDVVLSLPQLTAAMADRSQFFSFGRTIRAITVTDLARAGDARFYSESESRIQDALVRMNALPVEEIGVLVTDLFLTGEELFGGGAAIRAPLARILESGRSIGLIGIRSGFSGTVFDIPGVRPYMGASERPFYVVACGPASVVAHFIRRVETELLAPLPPTRDGDARHHAVLFTHGAFRAGLVTLPLLPGDGAEAAPALAADLGPEVSCVRFAAAGGVAVATVPLHGTGESYTLLPDRFRLAEQVWAEVPRGGSRAACGERWTEIRSLPPLARVETDDHTGDQPPSSGPGKMLVQRDGWR